MARIVKIEDRLSLKKAADFANIQFDGDFEECEPKIYCHLGLGSTYVCKDDNDVIQAMLSTFPFTFRSMKCLSIGTVCVDAKYRGQGIMRSMFEYLERYVYPEYDFILLRGNRDLYERFGFAKTLSNIAYKIDACNCGLKVRQATILDNDWMFDTYSRSNSLIYRDKATFFEQISANHHKIYVFEKDSKRCYAVYYKRENIVLETYGDITTLQAAASIATNEEQPFTYLLAPTSEHDKTLLKAANGYKQYIRGNVRINNVLSFIANCCVLKSDFTETLEFAVDGQSYKVCCNNDTLKIEHTTNSNCKLKYTSLQFAYSVFGYGGENELRKAIKPIIPSSIVAREGI